MRVMRESNRPQARGAAVVVAATLVLASCQLGLGGPNNTFGNDPTGPPGGQPGIWAAISGPFTRHQDGDPYATMCSGDITTPSTCDTTTGSGGTPLSPAVAENPDYSGNGYSWIVSVPKEDVGHAMTVQIYDPAISNTGSPLFESTGGPTTDFHTSYELFQTSGNTEDIEETPALSMSGKCTNGPGANVFGFGTNPGAPDFFESWYALCTFTPTKAGFYPLQVKTSNIPGVVDAGTGWNAYSLRATVGDVSTQPDVFAANHISTWSVPSGEQTWMYLANVASTQAGHTMLVDLYDPGDGVGPLAFTVQALAPPSGLAKVPNNINTVACSFNSTGSLTSGPATPDNSSNCRITTKAAGAGSGVYNGKWLRLNIHIPTSYTCTTDCWWALKFDWGDATTLPNDRMVASVNISTSAS